MQEDSLWQPKTDKATSVKPLKPLTRKQQAFVQELINNPKRSATQAAKLTYGKPDKPVTELSARNIASDNLTKPNILNELAKHSGTAEYTLIEVMQQSKKEMYKDKPRSVDWANTARQTADSLLDRLHGKATQRVEQHSTTVTLSLSLKDITDTSGEK